MEHPTDTPWWRRDKEQRRAVYEQAEAKRKATLKRRLDHIDQKYNPPAGASEQAPPATTPPGQQVPEQAPVGNQPPGHPSPRVAAGWAQTRQGDRAATRAVWLANLSLWTTLAPVIIGAIVFVIIVVLVLAIVL